jgi:hypothetical protein
MAAVLALAAPAAAHIERPSYFPDPAPDFSVVPPAGGAVPEIRSLASALDTSQPGETHVVCKGDSMARLEESLTRAATTGYEIRPSDRRVLSTAEADALRSINWDLFFICSYSEIQLAVNAAGNNDRVVIMPGLYTEEISRAQPTHDPSCVQYETNTEFGDPGALSYAYQYHCPNDQSLVAILGREPGPGTDPSPPLENRNGIPNIGPCIRCNLQIEGSGVSADDVIVDAGRVESGNQGPAEPKKDVVFRADRADGLVISNLTARHGREDGLYVIETDGYVFDRFKVYYNGSYGTLTFVSDHGLTQDCDAVGHSDSGVYPGAAPETGVQRAEGTSARLNQEIRRCDLHHNLAGYSGTNGNAVWFHHNNVYGNALGIQTDVVTAAGHPGFPGDSAVFERNAIHSNNFNPYEPTSDVGANFPFPVGTGMWIAGGNHHTIRENHIYDNWRRGMMLFTVPDALVCGDAHNNHQAGCDETRASTSHYNSYYDNIVGASPTGQVDPNGVDFWWDAFPGSRGNCWFRNSGPSAVTTSPATLPNCDDGKDPGTSIGTGDAVNEAELLGCLLAYAFDERSACPWFTTPPEPGSSAARRARRGQAKQRAAYRQAFRDLCATGVAAGTCRAYGKPVAAASSLTLSSPRSLTKWGLTGPAWTGTRKPLGQFTCRDWNRANVVAKRAIVRRLTTFFGGPASGSWANGWGTVLPVGQTHALFDDRCRLKFGKNFLLYKLYAFPAGFAGVAPPGVLMD